MGLNGCSDISLCRSYSTAAGLQKKQSTFTKNTGNSPVSEGTSLPHSRIQIIPKKGTKYIKFFHMVSDVNAEELRYEVSLLNSNLNGVTISTSALVGFLHACGKKEIDLLEYQNIVSLVLSQCKSIEQSETLEPWQVSRLFSALKSIRLPQYEEFVCKMLIKLKDKKIEKVDFAYICLCLQTINGQSPQHRQILAVLQDLLTNSLTGWNNLSSSISIYGLRNITEDSIEVRQFIQLLHQSIRSELEEGGLSQNSFTGAQTGFMIQGLRGLPLSSEKESMINLITDIIKKIEIIEMMPADVSKAVGGFEKMQFDPSKNVAELELFNAYFDMISNHQKGFVLPADDLCSLFRFLRGMNVPEIRSRYTVFLMDLVKNSPIKYASSLSLYLVITSISSQQSELQSHDVQLIDKFFHKVVPVPMQRNHVIKSCESVKYLMAKASQPTAVQGLLKALCQVIEVLSKSIVLSYQAKDREMSTDLSIDYDKALRHKDLIELVAVLRTLKSFNNRLGHQAKMRYLDAISRYISHNGIQSKIHISTVGDVMNCLAYVSDVNKEEKEFIRILLHTISSMEYDSYDLKPHGSLMSSLLFGLSSITGQSEEGSELLSLISTCVKRLSDFGYTSDSKSVVNCVKSSCLSEWLFAKNSNFNQLSSNISSYLAHSLKIMKDKGEGPADIAGADIKAIAKAVRRFSESDDLNEASVSFIMCLKDLLEMVSSNSNKVKLTKGQNLFVQEVIEKVDKSSSKELRNISTILRDIAKASE